MSDLNDRVIVVTGAASGMGRGCALHFAELGARVAAIDIEAHGLEETARTITAAGGHVKAGVVSVADGASVQRFIDGVVSSWGGIDGLVHAGAILRYGGILKTDLDTWEDIIRVNLTGAFIINRAVARSMAEAGRGGAIVNIASVAAVMGLSTLAAYSASKGGVAALSRSMAKELLPHGIRVNYICPGFVESGMTRDILEQEGAREARAQSTGMGRVCQPEDIAKACAFLLSDESSFIAGNGLMVDSAVSIAGG